VRLDIRSPAFSLSGGLAVAAALAALPAGAQSAPRDTVHLAEIVVTPTRVATPRSSVAAAVTVLDGRRLRAEGITRVSDALREVVGAAVVQPGSDGALTSLFLRGGESDYTSVLVDGVPLNDPGGAINLADLTMDNVDRIEVVRGPASVLYGSDAVSGVVQIFTRRGRGPARAEAGAEAGWFDGLTPGGLAVASSGFGKSLERWRAGLSGGTDAVGYSFSFSRASTGGLYGTPAFDNDYRNAVASALLRAQPDARTDASLMLRYGDHLFHYPTDGAGQLADANQYDQGTSTALGLEVGRFLLPRLETRLMLADYRTDGGTEDAPDGAADTLGFYAYHSQATVERRRAEARANWRASGAVLTAGGVIERQTEQSTGESQSSFGISPDQLDVRRGNHAAYVQLQGDPAAVLSVNAGARWDRSGTYGDFFTYRGGVVVRPLSSLRLRASAGTGFKEPTFYQNFAAGFARGNPNLKPEHSTSWEVGLEQSAWNGRANLAATYFDQRFSDLIDFTFAPPAPTDPNYFNIASARARGLELEAGLAPAERVALEGQATWLRTRVVEGGFDSEPGALLTPDSALLRRPSFTVAGKLRQTVSRRVRTTLSARHVGARADLDYTGYPPARVVLPAYGTVSFSLEGDVLSAEDRSVTLTARVENLFDTPYQEVVNFPARRRTVWLGARARF
jgi:vitamin B12 transporter